MSTLLVIGLVLLAKPAAPSRAPAPPREEPRPAPAATPAPAPAPPERSLLSRIQIGAGVGSGFSLSSGSSGLTGSGSPPPWVRGSIRGTLDLMRAGPGDLQLLLPVGIQGTSFNNIIQGSVLGVDVMPSIRYQAEVIPDLALFAELGVGFGSFQTTIQQPFMGYLVVQSGGAGLRMGAGLEYRVLGKLRLLVQPMELTALTVTSSVTVNGTTVTTTANASEWSLLLGAVHPL